MFFGNMTFFWNFEGKKVCCDFCLRRDVLVQFMQQVGDLKRRLSKLDHYRFYSSSLLIVYDGLPIYNSRLDSYDSDGDDEKEIVGEACERLSLEIEGGES